MSAFFLAMWLLAKPAVEIKVYNPVGPTPIRVQYRLDPDRVKYADTVISCEGMVVAGSRHDSADGAAWRTDWPLYEPCTYDAQIAGYNQNGRLIAVAHAEIDLP